MATSRIPEGAPGEKFFIDPPTDAGQLAAALGRMHGEITAAFEGLPLAAFLAPQGENQEFWSPADHLRHLTRSVGDVARGLGVPRLALAFRFGLARQPSLTFQEMREKYLSQLDAGGRAGGRYVPRPREESSAGGEILDDEAWRRRILESWRRAAAQLDAALPRWKEKALDRYQLPHPLLGKLTVREMLYFTLYHGRHHAVRVFERLEGSVG